MLPFVGGETTAGESGGVNRPLRSLVALCSHSCASAAHSAPAPLPPTLLQAARAAGAVVYAGAAKRAVLSCLDLSPEDRALITDSDTATNFHAVPMNCVTFKRMGHISAHYRGRYDTVVGFAPTGFGSAFGRSAKSVGRKRKKGAYVIYSVPYSEHSSFDELRAFVRWLRPARITPSVGNTSEEAAAEMVARLLA